MTERYDLSNDAYPGLAWDTQEKAKPNGQDRASDGRPRLLVPASDGALTPVMYLLDIHLSADQIVPPMRSIMGWPVMLRFSEPFGMHQLTADGANDIEDDNSRIPPPRSYILARHNVCTMALLIEAYISFYGIRKTEKETKDEKSISIRKKLISDYPRRLCSIISNGRIAHYRVSVRLRQCQWCCRMARCYPRMDWIAIIRLYFVSPMRYMRGPFLRRHRTARSRRR